jgi:nucleotide-binding universal stress UspA family protein
MTNGQGFAFNFPIEEYEKVVAERAEQILFKVRADAQDMVRRAYETVRFNEFPAEDILATEKAKQCDLTIMASHGRHGVARVLLGS